MFLMMLHYFWPLGFLLRGSAMSFAGLASIYVISKH